MAAQIIDGKAISAKIKEEMKREVAELRGTGIFPGLAVILVGENPASKLYVSMKMKACSEVGIEVECKDFKEKLFTKSAGRAAVGIRGRQSSYFRFVFRT